TVSSGASTTWVTQERSTSDGTFTDLSSQPQIAVVTADGSGTLAPSTSLVSAGTGRTLTFTYTAAGGTSGGSISLTAPGNWSAPSMTAGAPGYVTASTGTVSVLGQ